MAPRSRPIVSDRRIEIDKLAYPRSANDIIALFAIGDELPNPDNLATLDPPLIDSGSIPPP